MKKCSLLFLASLMFGCAAVPVSQDAVESLKLKHKLSENFVEVNNCSVYGWPSANEQYTALCGITNSEIVVMVDEKEENQKDYKSKSIKFNEIEKIGYKSKVRLHQYQLAFKQGFMAITLSPNKQFADAELTKKWYNFIVSKGVKEFTPDMYLQGASPQYQIIYK